MTTGTNRLPRRIWSDEVRERLKITTPLPVAKTEAIPKNHFHIWVERGYSGARSPRLGSTSAVNEELRDLLIELGGPKIEGNPSFPFTGLFILGVSEPIASDMAPSLNVAVGQCDGGDVPTPCNKTDHWR